MRDFINLMHARYVLFRTDKRGAAMIEYAILVGLITAAAVATIGLVGGKVSTAWSNLDTAFTLPK